MLQQPSFNPLVTNGISHRYHLDESTFILRGIRSNISFIFHFSMKIKKAKRIAPDGTPHLGLLCLPMYHKKDARLIWVSKTILVVYLDSPRDVYTRVHVLGYDRPG